MFPAGAPRQHGDPEPGPRDVHYGRHDCIPHGHPRLADVARSDL